MSQVNFDFHDYNFVVTGASSGMGKQVAIELAAAGAKVLAVARGKTALEAFTMGASAAISLYCGTKSPRNRRKHKSE